MIEETRAVRDDVNASIAHLDANPKAAVSLQFGQVDEALGVLEEELQALYPLVLGSSMATAEPAFQFSWRGAFLVPVPHDQIEIWAKARDYLRRRQEE